MCRLPLHQHLFLCTPSLASGCATDSCCNCAAHYGSALWDSVPALHSACCDHRACYHHEDLAEPELPASSQPASQQLLPHPHATRQAPPAAHTLPATTPSARSTPPQPTTKPHLDELLVVDLAVTVHVSLADHLVHLLVRELLAQVGHHMPQLTQQQQGSSKGRQQWDGSRGQWQWLQVSNWHAGRARQVQALASWRYQRLVSGPANAR